MARRDYAATWRRLLIDMHIPDWDVRFLRNFDAVATVRSAAAAHVTGLMLYFQSHTGLCNWPTRSGRQHPAFAGRDVMQALLDQSRAENLATCGYYSVNFNNWAKAEHPDWALQPAAPGVIGGGLLQSERYGICCLNNPGYRDFIAAQIGEIVTGYDIDAFFCDMVWWMSVCLCNSCRERHRVEGGGEIPGQVDWLNPEWCKFQLARERWLTQFAVWLRSLVHAHRPEIPVYHNFAVAATNWTRGVAFESASAHDFLGGDFYGGRDEQLLISRLMLNLSERRPVEFMTTVGANLAEHERLKSQAALDAQCLAATASHAAFLAILAIDPDGALNPAAIDRVGRMFARSQPWEADLGGTPVEDVAVYFSSASKMNFAENGSLLGKAASTSAIDYPHLHAVSGVCRVLQQAHLPFGVITRRQLSTLQRYRVLVLPNVLRMDDEEVSAVREYVRGGGCVYASRYSTLTSTAGVRASDFMLADVFGCHFDSFESGRNLYLSAIDPACAAALAPERALSHWLDAGERCGAVRLAERCAGEALLSLTLPYGYPSRGRQDGHDWSSIHSFPPWEHTDRPVVVENRYGEGRTIYSAADIESGNTPSHDALLLHLLRRLTGARTAFSSTAHPSVWMTVFEQTGANRQVIAFANQVPVAPPLPIPAFEFELVPPAGRRFARLLELPGNEPSSCVIREDGSLVAQVAGLDALLMFAAEFA